MSRSKFLALHTFVLVTGLFAIAKPALAEKAGEASRVRALLVIDTTTRNADKLGIAEAGRNVAGMFRATFARPEREGMLTLDIISGSAVSPASVLNHYRNLKVSPNETLFFYYYGHGGNDPKGGHFLAMQNGNLARSDLRAAMEAKQPRLRVIITDCCNTAGSLALRAPVTDAQKEQAADPKKKVEHKPANWDVVRHLLLTPHGLVDINSATYGRPAWGDPAWGGGLFTLTVQRMFRSAPEHAGADASGVIQWQSFFDVLAETVQKLGSHAGIAQTPEAFALPLSVTRLARATSEMESYLQWSAVSPKWRLRREAWQQKVKAAQTIDDLVKSLLELESQTTWGAYIPQWQGRRDAWLKRCSEVASLEDYGNRMRDLDNGLRWEAYSGGWKTRRPLWIQAVEHGAHRLSCPEDALAETMLALDAGIAWSSVSKNWQTRHDGWIFAVRSAGKVSDLKKLLIEQESNILWTAVDSNWESRRTAWLAACDEAKSVSDIGKLLADLENNIKPNAFVSGWKDARATWVACLP